jgi:hypothetical protein
VRDDRDVVARHVDVERDRESAATILSRAEARVAAPDAGGSSPAIS